ncbi:MAG TPA: immunoglobulin domain-containing protein [Verrucomicrobiota bacterium]|nr:immunoglobulin domain-containing protein [Verrucomicrobiota bacterium]
MNTKPTQHSPGPLWLGVAAAMLVAAAPSSLASIRAPYTPDANTKLLLHLDDATESGIAANAVAGAPAFIATANPSAATPRQPTPGMLGAPGASGLGYAFGTCANLSHSNSMALFMDANGNGVADLDTSGSALGEDRVSGSTLTGLYGEFTLEALVNFPSLTGANREIIAMDNSAGATSRPFQFRLNTTGQLEFNNIAVSGVNPKTTLPTTGPDAFVPNQWFHVALTYDGAGVITFYWTKLDSARTQANVLEVHYVSTVDLSGEAVLTVGNENRNTSGEGLLGLVDEVRISDVARTAVDMVFDPAIQEIPPSIDPEPENQFLGVGETLTIVAHASGSTPLSYRWQKGSGETFTDIPGETSDTLSLPVTFATEGDYRFVVTNPYGQSTSSAAQIRVGAIFSGLFPTGLNDARGLLIENEIDPHYTIWSSADPAYLGPDTIVPADTADYSANDEKSKWISPAPTLGGVRGVYTYRTTFVLDSAEPAGSSLSASVLTGGSLSVVLNGQPTGVANLTPGFPGPHRNLFAFELTDGFVPGLNTLDFVVDNATTVPNAPGGNALRVVSIRGVGPALASALSIVSQPSNQTVREGGRVTFACLAQGRPPLSYQWFGDNAAIPGATARTLSYRPVASGAQPTDFKVTVSNDGASLTSQTARLTVVPDNQPIVPASHDLNGFAGAPLLLSLSTLVQKASDPDGDPISLAGFDWTGENTSSPAEITQVDATLVYSNAPGFAGADRFNVTLTDGLGGDAVVAVNVQVAAALRLAVAVEPSGAARLSWPAGATTQGFKLYWSDRVDAPITNTVASPVWTEAGESVVRITPDADRRFYRLAYP